MFNNFRFFFFFGTILDFFSSLIYNFNGFVRQHEPHLQKRKPNANSLTTNFHGSGNRAQCLLHSPPYSNSHSYFPFESHFKTKNRIHNFISFFSFFYCSQFPNPKPQTRFSTWLGLSKRRRCSTPPNLRWSRFSLRRTFQSHHLRHCSRRRRRQVLILSLLFNLKLYSMIACHI